MGSNDPAHRSTRRRRKHAREPSAASVAPGAAADTTVGASSNSVASQGGLEASPTGVYGGRFGGDSASVRFV